MYLPYRYAPARCLALTQSEGILCEEDGLLAAGQLRKWAPLPSTSAFQLLPVIPSLVCTNPRPLQPKLEDQESQ